MRTEIRTILLYMLLAGSGLTAWGQSPEKPILRVFILAGQSNMQGQAVVDLDHPQHYNGGKGTLMHLLKDPQRGETYRHLRKPNGDWSPRQDVWIRYRTESVVKKGKLNIGFTGYEGQHHFGPELQFGHVVGNAFDEPVLLIKCAWGGKSLMKDFRPPSSGGRVGPYYVKMLEEIGEAMSNFETEFPKLKNHQARIEAFVWQQGWNDMCDDEACQAYPENLANLIRDIRQQFNQPDLPFVVGELGNGGVDANEPMKRFRAAQRKVTSLPEFADHVAFVPTAKFAQPADESPNVGHLHHWFGNAHSYFHVGQALGEATVKLIWPAKRVLILGDSISIGYTGHVRRLLADSAAVIRPTRYNRSRGQTGAENCAGTLNGVQHMDRWLQLADGRWDVIHFNFGLHDLKHVDPQTGRNSADANHPHQSPPDAYEKQLREIVAKLKATGAKLIFATTTPVPGGAPRPYRDETYPPEYNRVATRIMQENGIAINDLFELCKGNDKWFSRDRVHFTQQGSEKLAEAVATQIRNALGEE